MIYAAAVLPRDHTEPPTLMVGGRSGFAARLRGESWAILDPQTNVDFHTVLPLEDGRVLFAGVSGAAMTLDGDDRWQDHTEDLAIERTVWGGAVYRERIYLGLGQELVTLEVRKDGALEVVDRREMEVNTLCANDFLWCTGDELVERFDGTDWTVFECPANS